MAYSKLTSSIINILTAIAGTALILSGLYGIISPLSMSRTFGLIHPTTEAITFYPGLAGRNLGMGIAVWTLKFLGRRVELGVLVCCLLCNGFSDVYLMWASELPFDNYGTHLFNISVGMVVGPMLLTGA